MMAVKQVQMGRLMRDVLGERFLSLELKQVDHTENRATGNFSLVATFVEVSTGVERIIRGEGRALAEVAFNALIGTLIGEYPSISNLRSHSFSLERGAETEVHGDSQSTAHLAVDNQVGHTFRFSASSRSVVTACLEVSLSAIEYFINSELAFYRVHGFLDDARNKDRPDLVDRYTEMLTHLVMNSLYVSSTEHR